MNTDLKNYNSGVQDYVRKGEKIARARKDAWQRMKKCRFDTISVHGLYTMQEALEGNQGSIIEPAYLSTSQGYRDSDEMEAALAYMIPTWCYARIANPTTYYLEWTLALMETYGTPLEASAVVTASGMSAIMSAVEPFLIKQDSSPSEPINFVSSAHVYGGTFQQFSIRQAEKGRQVRWIADPMNLEEWESSIDEHTRFLYTELPSNPTIQFCDLEKLAEIAHRHGIPLIVDSTVATPALMRPLAHGADVVVHSVSKSMTSSGMGVGGVIIARKNIVSRFGEPEMKADFASWVKFLPFRDNGPSMNPMQALMILNDLRTLRSRMDLVSRNSQIVAEFLESHPAVERVDYLGLPSNPLHELASRYMNLADSEGESGSPKKRYGHLMSFQVRGGGEAARRVFDGFELIYRATDLGRIKSVATIPAISTHQQQGEEARAMADVPPSMIRLNVGGEDPRDLIVDLERGLKRI
ncbi:MAG: aminotransferase class I/II-fold pyridoxal phosphate-dependent enzyme [Candidatus Krumholzibacteria bacterium]|nr:aminotransferase class I/II-fold pyridoxal phosphate-dependent enzyme [Candidatus Krumholzibacteria bacterium]